MIFSYVLTALFTLSLIDSQVLCLYVLCHLSVDNLWPSIIDRDSALSSVSTLSDIDSLEFL